MYSGVIATSLSKGLFPNIFSKSSLKITSFGNLPEWADNPRDFWENAEKHRNKPNGRAYREFKFALQEELTLEEIKALDPIKRFKYYFAK